MRTFLAAGSLLQVLRPLPTPTRTISRSQGCLARDSFWSLPSGVINPQWRWKIFFLPVSLSAFVLSDSGPFFFSLLSQLTCVRLQDTACKTQPRGAGRDSGWATGQPRAHSSAPQPALPRSPSGIPPTHLPAGQDGETNEKGVWALTLGSGVHLGGLVHLLRPPFGRATYGAKSVGPLLWSDSSLRAC